MRPTRFHRLAAVIAAALALSAAPSATPALAQGSPPAEAAAAQPSASSALPGDQLAAPPRTLRAYWHVFIAFTLAWLFLFGYALSLGRRFGRLEREVDSLRGAS